MPEDVHHWPRKVVLLEQERVLAVCGLVPLLEAALGAMVRGVPKLLHAAIAPHG